MSLVHDLIDHALAADLTQNELKVFLVLLRQTLCYGKTSDPLTLKRLASLTHIRKDRVLPAIQGVLETGLFETKPHKVFETEYFISSTLLTQPKPEYFIPSLPKNGKPFSETEVLSEKRVHTTKTSTIETSTTTEPPSRSSLILHDTQPLKYPNTFNTQDQTAAAKILDGLSPTDAQDCLTLLIQALQTQVLKNPLGYLHQLAKAARENRLDRGRLAITSSTLANGELQQRLLNIKQTIQQLDYACHQTGGAMDAPTAMRRAHCVDEYNQLSQVLKGNVSCH